ncbi:hypothetical protein NL676_034491 [Syzygium grande]|nr:hypothetical protein NL676_034491 [Syzygium grande]
MKGQASCLILALSCVLHLASTIKTSSVPKENPAKEMIQVGLVHSTNSTARKVVTSCISTMLSNFYGAHFDFRTRLSLHVRDPEDDVVDAASAGKIYALAVDILDSCW